MNLPNKITTSRIVMVPLFFVAFSLPLWFGPSVHTVSVIATLILYVCMELSDLIDGYIARKHHIITDLGKVMDPFADTLTHLTFFVCFSSIGLMPTWALLIIMWREFFIVFLRMLMMKGGKAVAANIWGKAKTVLYALSSILAIAYVSLDRLGDSTPIQSWALPTLEATFTLAALASAISFTTYMVAIVKTKSLSHLSR